MSDPFDGVTPIGDRRPKSLRLSRREQHVRAHADHSAPPAPATLSSSDPGTGTPKEPSKRRRRLTPSMTLDEAKAMTERMIRLAYREATRPGGKAVEAKYAAAKFGIAIDKWQMLSGRPTQIHEVREERAGLKELALRLLQGGAAS